MIVMNYMTNYEIILRLLKLEINCGKGGAIIRGINRARGRYILMVNIIIFFFN